MGVIWTYPVVEPCFQIGSSYRLTEQLSIANFYHCFRQNSRCTSLRIQRHRDISWRWQTWPEYRWCLLLQGLSDLEVAHRSRQLSVDSQETEYLQQDIPPIGWDEWANEWVNICETYWDCYYTRRPSPMKHHPSFGCNPASCWSCFRTL